MNFTKIFKLDHSAFYAEFDPWRKSNENEVPVNGVYIIMANEEIPRCLKPDPQGILYIGRGNIMSYHNRIGKLINSFNEQPRFHEAGIRFHRNPLLQNRFPISSLKVGITLTEEPEELEKQLLQDYFQAFGDVPPLNRVAY
jgi:hypothetical protein